MSRRKHFAMPLVDERAMRRRFNAIFAEVEAAGADGDTAQAVASIAVHLEAHRSFEQGPNMTTFIL